MIRINLLPKEERVVHRRRKVPLPAVGAMAPVAVLVVVFAGVLVTAVIERARVNGLRGDVVELRDEVRAIQPQVDRVKRLTAQREELERRLNIIRGLDDGRFLSVRVMDNLSREVPQYLWLSSVVQTPEGNLDIRGVTFSNLIVADFMIRLERSPMFAQVDLGETVREDLDGRDVMNFRLSATLTPDEAPSDYSADALLEELLMEAY
jgi:Tfp pilus assembly protein PilN